LHHWRARGGFNPEVTVCTDDVPRGRPAPWMIFRAAERLNAFPLSSIIVVDDTPVGIEAGLNAGAWTVAVTRTGNSLGLSEDEVARLDPSDRVTRLASADQDFRSIGAHYVIESVADLLPVIEDITARLVASPALIPSAPSP
jgi:phosphonoacetaldehyde hydrolase